RDVAAADAGAVGGLGIERCRPQQKQHHGAGDCTAHDLIPFPSSMDCRAAILPRRVVRRYVARSAGARNRRAVMPTRDCGTMILQWRRFLLPMSWERLRYAGRLRNF